MSLAEPRDPKAQKRFDRAQSAFEQGDFSFATEALLDLLEKQPNDVEACFYLAMAFNRQGLVQRAMEAYERTLDLFGGHEFALVHLAMLCEEQNRPSRAWELYGRATKVNPKNLTALKGLAFQAYRQGQLDQAQAALAQAFALEPASPWGLELQGLIHLSQGALELAIESFSRSLAQDNRNPSVWNNLGNSHLKNHQIQEAENAYRQALSLDPKNSSYWFNLGELLFHYATKAEAIDPFLKVIEAVPSDLEARKYLAQAQLEARPKEAEASFLALIEQQGESTELIGTLAQLYSRTGEREKEVEQRLKLSKLNPYDLENNFAIAQIRLSQGKPEIAYKLLQDCLTLSEKEYETWYRLAQTFQLEEKLEEEFNCLEKVLKANPAHHAAWTRLGQVAFDQGLVLKAFKYWIKAAPALKNDPELWPKLAERLAQAGAWDEALQACDQVFEQIAFAPAIWEGFYRMFCRFGEKDRFLGWMEQRLYGPGVDAVYGLGFARLWERLGLQTPALELYKQVAEQYPLYLETYGLWANALLSLNRAPEAYNVALRGLKVQPLDYGLIVTLGEAYGFEGRLLEAQTQFQKALELRRDDWRVWFHLANLAAKQGLFERAVGLYEESLRFYDSEPKTHYNLSLCLKKLGRLEMARKELQRSLQLNRRQPQGWSALGSLDRELGEFEAAKRHYLKALALDRAYQTGWVNLAFVYGRLGQGEKQEACKRELARLTGGTIPPQPEAPGPEADLVQADLAP
ncbi:MAG: hypothetical protein A2600_04040 [Candidatus Lambdaproteobacteria bacterium RIFOXYD1_FULL_56_27]|uniref:Uncharacterized protein n=1 Tax=Candidatus Lambdaproteobacteria bacterium RIFOXYD2_FULL_56_26 TaxID=1817773 RepID=A0A1F6H3H1_9PROT|nr:MAG: hypothetical protein A2557_08105 [Candidatus Lambdaproteobacteria bacterium RIFOXYD2_FULL_56_26]OGH09392.1 MAG: hypothetical protein A2600_04040 [Candidatus Lambdaproteobacteria bacterium RIFOXYD1_FULL_56_27]